MEAQKIVIKIARQKSELIPFDLEKWNTGEYDVMHEIFGQVRVLCTDNKGNFPIVIALEKGTIRTYAINGHYTLSSQGPSIFLRKKLKEPQLPNNIYQNVYPGGINDNTYRDKETADRCSSTARIGLVYVTYEWED